MWSTKFKRRDKMKKILLTFLTTLIITAGAFADTNSGFNLSSARYNNSTFEIGATYGTISYVNKNNSASHTNVSGWGLAIGDYEQILPFIGTQTSAFFIFPEKLKQYKSNGTVSDLSYAYNSPFVMSFEAMLMLNIPFAIFDLRAGAGIAYTLHYESNSFYYTGSEAINHYFAVPVSVSASASLGNIGLKVGCDFQFVFANFITQDGDTQELKHLNYDTYVILPYVAATFKF